MKVIVLLIMNRSRNCWLHTMNLKSKFSCYHQNLRKVDSRFHLKCYESNNAAVGTDKLI